MSCISIGLLICMFTAVSLATLYRDPDFTTEWSVTESVREARQGAGEELGALLDAGDGAVVTLEAGGTRLAVHRAVLAARSPTLASMLPHHSAEAGGGLSVPDMEGPVLRRLLAYLYTLRAPRLPPGAATQLLAAAHRLGLPALQADCERQVVEQLSVETAASAAVLAVKLALTDLRDAAINFIKDHRIKVLATKGWADVLENQPKEAAEVSHLLADRLAEIWLSVPDMVGPVLRRLLAYLYTLRAPRLPPGAATQLLAAAHRLGLPALQADCERQVAEQLSVETAASAAVLALRLALTDLREAAVNYIKEHFVEVVDTKGWPDAEENQPREVIKVTLLLAGRMAKNGAPATTEAETSASMEAGTTTTTEAGTTEAGTTEAGTTASSQPHSASQTPATAAPPLAACPTAPLDEATVSRLRSLSRKDRDRKLIQAAEKGAVRRLRALLAAGADVGARDEGGKTGLHKAAWEGHAEAASCLLGAGAQVDARDRWQETPLHVAAWWGHAVVARLLLAASADPNARDNGGDTPLHYVAWSGRAEVVPALLEAGADRGARNDKGRTPLDIARRQHYQHIIDMLTQR